MPGQVRKSTDQSAYTNYNYSNNIPPESPQPQAGVNPHKPKYSNISKELEDLKKTLEYSTSFQGKFANSIQHLVYRISAVFDSIMGNSKEFEGKRALNSYRTQEHLMYGQGGLVNLHNKAFQNAFNENEKFHTLQIEYGRMIDWRQDQDMRKGNYQPWVDKIQSNLSALTVGESLWISCSSRYGHHAMMMRIEKHKHSFTLHYANTGGGLENDKFHPKKINEDGTESFRLVAQIENIPEDTLLNGNFLNNLAKVLKEENAAPQSSNVDTKNTTPEKARHERAIPTINAVYRTLDTLLLLEGTTLNATDDERNWGRAQITGSCTASCIWAMTRTRLTAHEFRDLEVKMQVKSLVKHYKQIESGKDTSSTRKIMVLDLVESLKKDFNCSADDRALLGDIEKKVKDSLKMHNAELKISTSSRVSLDKFINKDKGELAPFIPKISKEKIGDLERQGSILKAGVKIENDPAAGFQYKVKKNESGQWEGVDLNDKIALVCFHIANGDHDQTDACMKDLIIELSKQQIQDPKDLTDEDRNKQIYTEKLLISLAEQFRQFDNTRSGVAKQVFLSSLVLQMFCKRHDIDFNEYKTALWKGDDFTNADTIVRDKVRSNIDINPSKTDQYKKDDKDIYVQASKNLFTAKRIYANLKVESYLDDDNIWIQGLSSIDARKPKPALPSQPNLTPHHDYHIPELLENTPDTEGETNQAALKILHPADATSSE